MIRFNSRNSYFKTPFGAIEQDSDLTFRILVSRRVCALKVSIVFEGERAFKLPLSFSGSQGIYEEYSITMKIPNIGLYFYRFEIENTNNDTIYIGKGYSGNAEISPIAPWWKLTVYNNSFKAANTFAGKNIYQIFPDRFCYVGKINTEKHNNIKPWGMLPNHIREEDGTLDTSDFFGGNLKGIQSKLEYLKELGIGIIYLNPIFEAASNHRYDTGDYEKIDTLLGNEDDFTELCAEAEKYGIRIILDGVFSHTGIDSKYFNQYGNYDNLGAYQSQESEYSSWYKFVDWPNEYDCWWGVKILPETREDEPSYLSYITGENGIARKWLRAGASGWRLDVADELPDVFIEKFREAVKAENEEAVIIGEVWENAADKISYDQRRRYLHGNQLDSVMNYVFRNAVISFMQDGDSEKIKNSVLEICEDYPAPVLHSLMNFLGTHDTERIKNILGSECEVCLAYALLAFLPGLPTIYYGDEVGMEGGKDPLNRQCFPWNEGEKEITSFFKKINNIRLELSCLKNGSFEPIITEKDLFGFCRSSDEEKCLFLINISKEPKLIPELFVGKTDLFHGNTINKNSYINGKNFIIVKY
ncbi:MAG: glycoside hydrolase family 13 protein [Ruminococcaceae bacterium]|nr:glycoside hydrolase family 13 protein [Oscillospiraceae bacterium]